MEREELKVPSGRTCAWPRVQKGAWSCARVGKTALTSPLPWAASIPLSSIYRRGEVEARMNVGRGTMYLFRRQMCLGFRPLMRSRHVLHEVN